MIRINALLLLKRIFGTARSHRISLCMLISLSCSYGLVALLAASLLAASLLAASLLAASLLAASLICHPIAAAWDSSITGTCANQVVSYVLIEILGAFIDLVIVVLPAALLRIVHMSVKDKIKAVCILSAGAVYVVV